ncbi:MAG TPA: hypothetical protein VLA56_10750, partial [Pseudomonadales bacterium]|nr:hypothetical protein [Pseudomonadales bacterium]
SSEDLFVGGTSDAAGSTSSRRGATRVQDRIDDRHRRRALGWFAVHYLQSDPDLTARMGDFLLRTNRGEAPASAFPAAFERSFDDFDDELEAYWRKGDMVLRGVPLTGEDADPPVRGERMPALNDRFWIAEAQLYTGYHPEPEGMREAFAKALDALDDGPAAWRERVIIDKAELETDLDAPGAALALLSALPAGSVHRARILAETARAHVELAQIGTARSLLAAALDEFPDDPALLTSLVRTHLLDDEAGAETALPRLAHLQAVFPQHDEVQRFAALLYAEAGLHDRAIESLEWERSFARSEAARAKVDLLLEQIELHRKESGGAPMAIRMGAG